MSSRPALGRTLADLIAANASPPAVLFGGKSRGQIRRERLDDLGRRFPRFVPGFVSASMLPPDVLEATEEAIEQGPDGIEVAR